MTAGQTPSGSDQFPWGKVVVGQLAQLELLLLGSTQCTTIRKTPAITGYFVSNKGGEALKRGGSNRQAVRFV